MKKIFLFLSLISFGFAQSVPLNNPTLTGTVSIPAITNSILYSDASGHVNPVTIAGNLTFSGGTLTGNGGGGSGGVTQITAGPGIYINPTYGTGLVNIEVNGVGTGNNAVATVTGTSANQITASVSGSGSNVILSLPQDIGLYSSPTFDSLTVGHSYTSSAALAISSAANGNSASLAAGEYLTPTLISGSTSSSLYGIASNPAINTGNYSGSSLIYSNLALGSGSGGSSKIATSAQIQINPAPSAQTTYGIWQTGTDQNYFGGSITSVSSLTAASGLFNGSATTGLWVNTSSSLNSYGINDTPTVTFPSGYNGYSFNSLAINPNVINNSTSNLYFGIHLGPVNLTGSQSFAAAYQLYISAAPSTTSSLNKYGIYQQGTDQNYFNGNITTPNITLVSGGGGKITFADGTTQTTAATGGGGGSVSISAGTGISVSPSPITGTGTVSLASAYAGNGIGTVSGLAKGNGSGTIIAATAGADYTTPSGSEGLNNKNINNSSIGSSTPSTGAFTTLSSTGTLTSAGNNSIFGASSLFLPTAGYNYNFYAGSGNGQISLGQSTNYNVNLVWYYNSTPANAYAVLATFGNANPLEIDSSQLRIGSVIRLQHYTVGTLPSAGANQYGECFVSDSTDSPGSNIGNTTSGGGGYVRKVYSDGSNWLLE